MKDHAELPNTRVIPPRGPELVNIKSSDYDDTFVSARCFSTLPPAKSGDRNSTPYYLSSYSNRMVAVMSQRHPFKGILETVVEYLEENREKINDIRDAGHYLLRSFAEAYQKITTQKGDSTLLAVMLLELEQHHPSDPQYGVLCANMGDCKAFLANEKSGEVVDITHGSWISGHWIESGGIKRHRKCNPELCNLRLYFKPCKKDDIILMMSSGMHENLDPVVMGKIPQPSIHLFSSLTTFKSDHICSLLRDMISSTSSFSPSTFTDSLMKHALRVTHIARYVHRLLGGGGSWKTGHMGCIACIAFYVGAQFYESSSPSSSSLSQKLPSRTLVDSQGQLREVKDETFGSNAAEYGSDLSLSFTMVLKTIVESDSSCLPGKVIGILSLVNSQARVVLLPLMQKRLTFRSIEGRKLKSFSPLKMITDSCFNIPATVTHLTFSYNFNQRVDNLLPSSILYLTFGHHFNQRVSSLPPSLIHLTFGDHFNYPLPSLPATLTHLTLGMEFNESVDKLPSSLISLSLGECFEGPITTLPSLQFLSITSVKCKIKYLPSSLKHLACGDYLPIISSCTSLTHLTLGESFGCPSFTQQVILPPNLIHLSFGDAFNRPFIIPSSLTHLHMGGSYNQPFSFLPSSLTHLELGDSFNQPLPPLPPFLTHLTLGHYFEQPLDNVPSSLSHVIVRNRKLLYLRHSYPEISFVYSLRKIYNHS